MKQNKIKRKDPTYMVEWRKQNREHCKIYNKNWSKTHPESKRRSSKKNYENHKEQYRERSIKSKQGLIGLIFWRKTPKICSCCGKTKRLAIHHVNGNRKDSSDSNLCILCNSCHAKAHKYTSVPDNIRQEWLVKWYSKNVRNKTT